MIQSEVQLIKSQGLLRIGGSFPCWVVVSFLDNKKKKKLQFQVLFLKHASDCKSQKHQHMLHITSARLQKKSLEEDAIINKRRPFQ